MAAKGNDTVNWEEFEPKVYIPDHYSQPLKADIQVAAGIIAVLAELPNNYPSYIEIGSCGVLRTACLAAPILTPNAPVRLTDIAEPQLEQTIQELARARSGKPTMWDNHVAHMAKTDIRWGSSLATLGSNPNIVVEKHNIVTTKLGAAAVRAEAHCLCSITSDAEQQEHGFDNFTADMEPGDVAIRLFDVDSTGYWVNGFFFPGWPINPDTVTRQAESRGLEVRTAFAVRVEHPLVDGTGSTFTALGGAVLLKSQPRTILDLAADGR